MVEGVAADPITAFRSPLNLLGCAQSELTAGCLLAVSKLARFCPTQNCLQESSSSYHIGYWCMFPSTPRIPWAAPENPPTPDKREDVSELVGRHWSETYPRAAIRDHLRW